MAIRKISKIRQYLDYDTATRLVHALVTSRLDSCNSLLYGLPDKDLAKLQRIQNIAARLICRIPPSQHITPILQNLHWLPVNIRIAYKINLLTYKSKAGLSPTYLSNLLLCYTIMFHHGLYAPHLSPFSNFHTKFLPNPMVKDHSFMLPHHYGTTYHSKSVLPIMWTF